MEQKIQRSQRLMLHQLWWHGVLATYIAKPRTYTDTMNVASNLLVTSKSAMTSGTPGANMDEASAMMRDSPDRTATLLHFRQPDLLTVSTGHRILKFKLRPKVFMDTFLEHQWDGMLLFLTAAN